MTGILLLTFNASFQQWIIDYNFDFPHQSLAYQTPQQAMGAFVSKEVSIV